MLGTAQESGDEAAQAVGVDRPLDEAEVDGASGPVGRALDGETLSDAEGADLQAALADPKNCREAVTWLQFDTAVFEHLQQREKIISPKNKTLSPKKKDVLLAPQYNTWGVESALALPPEELTESIVKDIFNKFQRSGMQARTFVIDDKWEGQYGELKHDAERFPNFESLLNHIRGQGYYVGLWAAFLRCQNPAALGLDESHLLQTHAGGPLWLAHQTSRYGIFDVTQPQVQDALRKRAKEFIQRYNPDLIKFDFGYELPSLDIAAPADMNWAGELLLQKGLEVIVGAMKEENPDLVIMYYGLSPLLIHDYDLHSPDDLVYCVGDYDLETNRRIFFSSLCGELSWGQWALYGCAWCKVRFHRCLM